MFSKSTPADKMRPLVQVAQRVKYQKALGHTTVAAN